jgi:hypothetical protein
MVMKGFVHDLPPGHDVNSMSICQYRRTSISGTKKAHMTSSLSQCFPLKVVK